MRTRKSLGKWEELGSDTKLRFRSRMVITCCLIAVLLLLAAAIWLPQTIFSWLIVGSVFGIPALISVGFFILFTGIFLRRFLGGKSLQGK